MPIASLSMANIEDNRVLQIETKVRRHARRASSPNWRRATVLDGASLASNLTRRTQRRYESCSVSDGLSMVHCTSLLMGAFYRNLRQNSESFTLCLKAISIQSYSSSISSLASRLKSTWPQASLRRKRKKYERAWVLSISAEISIRHTRAFRKTLSEL